MAVFPELAITGYPPEDLVLKPGFVAANRAALDKVAARTGRCAAVVGFVDADRDLYNAAAVCAGGAVVGRYQKRLLPNYAVFDEQRYFAPGAAPLTLFEIAGVKVGVAICEDVWSAEGPIAAQSAGGAELVVIPNGSPYFRGRHAERERMVATRAEDAHCHIAYVNQVGGQDELIFDGGSFVVDDRGDLLHRSPQLTEVVDVVDLDIRPVFRTRLLDPRGRDTAPPLPVVPVSAAVADHPGEPRPPVDPAAARAGRRGVRRAGARHARLRREERLHRRRVRAVGRHRLVARRRHRRRRHRPRARARGVDAEPLLVRGLQDRRRGAVRGDRHRAAHDPDRAGLHGVPRDAGARASRACPRTSPRRTCSRASAARCSWRSPTSSAGWLVLTTGNKSELAVGYSTLYGDTAGGFAVIKDVPKLLVYDLCRLRNERAGREIIPEAVLTKPPSAELRPDQRDDQSLPPYEQLDPLLEAYVEDDLTRGELIAQGFDPAMVDRITRLVDLSEYKRRQNPPGPRISAKAFGKDRRMPITNGYRG